MRIWTHQKAMRGLALIGVALFFGIQSATYQLGSMAHAGAGMFPLMISALVGLIGVVMLIQAHFEQPEPMKFHPKNIAIILASLGGFVVISQHVGVIVAIVYLVFLSGFAGADYSVRRNVQISVVLIAIAAAFHYFLGLSLPLI